MMKGVGGTTGSGERLHFLDNLRTTMIFLVVLYHSGAVYESSGLFASFWLVDDPATNDLVGLVNVVVDIFVMSTIFFVSGFLAPVSLVRRPGLAFVAHRLRRLMVPWLVAVLTLVPVYKVIFLYSRQLPQEHWTTYFHFSNGIFSQSWLWFLPVLFWFDVAYWGLLRSGIRMPRMGLRTAVVAVFLIGLLYSFGMSMLGGTGWTKTALVDFQNERLLIYFLMFLLGVLCFRLRVFDAPSSRKRLYIAVSCTLWIPINVYVIVLLNLVFNPGQYIISPAMDVLMMWGGFHLSLLGSLYLLLTTCRLFWNRRGKLTGALNANAYGVYIVHLPVLGVTALALLDSEMASVWKYVILTLSTFVLSNALVHAYRVLVKPRLVGSTA